MPRSHLVAYLLIAAAVGWLGGLMFERSRTAPASNGGTAIAADATKDGASPTPPPVGSDSQRRAEAAIAAQKWSEAVSAIRSMIGNGSGEWDDALALILRILSVEDPVEYALRESEMDPLAKEIAFLKDSVPLARATGTFASELYLELAFAWLGEARESKYLVECLDGASDEELQRILRAIELCATPDLVPVLVARLKAAATPGARLQYLRPIAACGPSALPALREVAASPDRQLADAANAMVQMLDPPATGFLVMNPPGREGGRPRPPQAAALHRGDIIVEVDGSKIDSEEAWKRATGRFSGRGFVTLKVVRAGKEESAQSVGAMGAPKGKFVVKGGAK